jgi:acyl-CoA thioesterase-1
MKHQDTTKPAILRRMVIALTLIILALIVLTGIRLFFLQRQVAGYREYWQQQAAEQPQQDSITYIALGDSGAQGIGASNPEKSYVGLLEKAIAEEANKPVHTINISVSGAKVADVSRLQIPQLKDLNITGETIVTLSIGGNDAVHRNPNFQTDIDKLFSELPSQTIVSDVGYFGGGRYRSRQPYVDQVNPYVYVAAKKYNLTVAPLHEITKARNSPLNNAVDIFHPSNRGYRNWFDAFWPAVGKQLD